MDESPLPNDLLVECDQAVKAALLDGEWSALVDMFESHATRSLPAAVVFTGDDTELVCPVEHRFEAGRYFRELTSAPGVLALGRTHRMRNVWVLLEGRLTVWSEHGCTELEAPAYGVTEPGTRRCLLPHTQIRFLTIHELEPMPIEEAEAIIFED